MAPILRRVIRLLFSILCALGLALAPVAASAAIGPNTEMPGCRMDGKMPAKPVDHAKMDCCAPACQAPASAALMPRQDTAASVGRADKSMLAWAPEKELASIASSGLDPPPRA